MKNFMFILLVVCFINITPAVADDREIKSIVTTNYYKMTPQDKLYDIERPIRILDLGYIQYTKEFAEKYGYPEQFITDELSEGMEAVEFRMVTHGIYNECYLNVLINNKADIALPERDFIRRDGRKERFRLPKAEKKAFVDGQIQPQRFYGEGKKPWSQLVTSDFRPATFKEKHSWGIDDKGEGSTGGSLTIQEFSTSYFVDNYFYSFLVQCQGGGGKVFWNSEKAELWIPTKKTSEIYTDGSTPTKRSLYATFKLPSKLREKVSNWLEIGKYNSFTGVTGAIETRMRRRNGKNK